uniref:Clp R domain-containing protein n=1 Tax=Leersia perrieri TaxID=77586 RepID=A0A0D9XP86_9ORYZ
MRAGGCAVVQQALAAEAAAVVRQAVTLARRRGHAQVTPLHVASAMLSVSGAGGLLRAACLRSHSHPLQCKALELCFNVALNRLPTAAPAAAMLNHHHAGAGHHGGSAAPPPALSNALVAAFKRAQAHQRRGTTTTATSVEGNTTTTSTSQAVVAAAAAKVELEQLIISILDDPSVSRVMREAGFSSSQVKSNLENAAAAAVANTNTNTNTNTAASQLPTKQITSVVDGDAMRVLDYMASGAKRSVVVVGGEGASSSPATAEAVVKAVMDRVSKGELHHRHVNRLKSLQFVPLSVASFRGAAREEVESKAGDLRALVGSARAAGKGVVLVLEDLAFAADAWNTRSRRRAADAAGESCGYCPVEHAVMEVSSLVSSSSSGGERFWVLGFGSYPAYMKCRVGDPPLEAVWELHPVVVPDGGGGGGLALSLSCSEASQASQAGQTTGWPFVNGGGEAAAAMMVSPASLPSWLRRYHEPDHATPASCAATGLQLQDLWNPIKNGSTPHHTSELTLSFSSPSPSISGFTSCYNTNMMRSKPWQLVARQPWPINGHEGHTTMPLTYHDNPLDTNPSPESNSVSNSSDGEPKRPKFTELNAENLKIMCNALESHVPQHSKIVLDIASTVLQCRSGMMKKMRLRNNEMQATWLLFQGRDCDGKKAMAQELAKLVFGSYTEFTSISVDELVSTYSDSSTGELTLKRQRSLDNNEHSFAQRLCETLNKNPHQVILIDGIEQLDHDSETSIKKVIANGRMRGHNGEEIDLEDAIIVMSCEEEFDSRSRASSPRIKQRLMANNDDEESSSTEKGESSPRCFSLDLNACLEDGEDQIVSLDSEMHSIVDGVFFFRLMTDL